MTADGTDLADLIHHWGSAYRISHPGASWVAVRRDNGIELRADSAALLLRLIRSDYQARPSDRTRSP